MLLWESFYVKATFFWYPIIFLSGLVMGSFINSWIWRVHENVKIFSGKSICVNCRRKLSWYENIPLVGFLFLRGRCKICKQSIPKHYVLVELVLGLIFVWRFHNYLEATEFDSLQIYRDVFLILILSILFIYDALYRLVLLPVVWLGIVVGIIINYKQFLNLPNHGLGILVGVIIGILFFGVQWLVSSGKWIGVGDIYLGVWMGVWLGWKEVLIALLLAYVAAAIYGLFMMLFKQQKWKSEIPLAPFLTLATFVVYYYSTFLLNFFV
jgi:prepilin signal peptidase PulO-like enzyme (type II secretory pathway)